MPSPPRIALVTFYDPVSLGVRSLHAVLAQAGFPTDLIFFRDHLDPARPHPSEREYQLLLDLILEQKPALLGLSFRSFGFKIASRITRAVKARLDTLVVWGGTHPTLAPEDCAAEADVVCLGEGEGAMLELAEAVRDGREISGIRNLWVRQGEKIIRNPLRPLQQDLDSLPFPVLGDQGKFVIERDQLFPFDPYLGPRNAGDYYLAASRGCPFVCDYCCNSAFRRIYQGGGAYVRRRSPEHVLAELEQAQKQLKLEKVAFMDEVFSLDKTWTLSICRGYQERVGLPFKCEVHPQTVDEELVAGMKAANLAYAVVGVQSGSERVRRELYHREMSNAEILAAAELLHRFEVIPYYDLILDNPYETEDDLAQTLDLVCRLPRPFNLEIFSLAFFPGTAITERALANQVITPDQVEGRAQKTLTGLLFSIARTLNPLQAYHAVLLALSLTKLDRRAWRLGYNTTGFSTSRHLVPPTLLRWLSRRPLFRRHAPAINTLLKFCLRAGNGLLAPLRWSGRAWQALPLHAKENHDG
jgi:anaerobic magnesium-protoporphyrin IX monomethyl ester cyclase